MNRTPRRTYWIIAALVTLASVSLACGRAAQDAAPEAVRQAAEEHVRASGGEMTFDDPSGDGRLQWATGEREARAPIPERLRLPL